MSREEKSSQEIEPREDVIDGIGDPLVFLLRRKTPEDVLSALSTGDPFKIYAKAHDYLRSRYLLLELDRLRDRALVRIAVGRMSYSGEPELGQWLSERIEDAAEDLIREDEGEVHEGESSLEEWDPRYGFLVDMIGIPPEKARSACVAFNGLPLVHRRSFFLACVDGLGVPGLIEATGMDREELRDSLIRSLEALLDKKDLKAALDARVKERGPVE